MKAISAADAKNAFGTFLDAVQREPVVVTKQNRPVGMMFSMADVKILFGDHEDAVQTALNEAKIEEQLKQARQQIKAGLAVDADATFFESMRSEIRSKHAAIK